MALDGRAPQLDDVCAICEFELGVLAMKTMAYLASSPSRSNGRQYVVHYCPRHATEVEPLSAGRYTGWG